MSEEDLCARLRTAAEAHALPPSREGLGAAAIRRHLGALMEAMVATELEKRWMLGERISGRDEKRIKADVLPAIRKLIEPWVSFVESRHGNDGLSFVAEVAEDADYYFPRGLPRRDGGRYSLSDEQAEAIGDERIDEAMGEGQVELMREGDRIVAATVRGGYGKADPTELLEALLNNPHASRLEGLKLGLWGEGSQNEYMDAIDALASNGPYPELRSFVIGEHEHPDETELSWTDVGDVDALWALMPALEELHIRGGGIGLGTVAHATLKRLVIETTGLSASAARSVAALDCPALETLELSFGDPERGASGGFKAFEPFFDKDLPKLRHLHLRNAMFTDEMAVALGSASFAPSLVTLDLSRGTLGNEGVAALVALGRTSNKLRVLDIDRNCVDGEGVSALRVVFGNALVVGKQGDRDDADDDEDHYDTISE